MDLLLILLALFLVLLNGFFVAAEFAIVKLRRTRVEAICKVYGIRGAVLSRIHANLDSCLSATQLGITLASLGLGWIGEPAFARLLGPVFEWLGISSPRLIEVSSFAVAFLLISYLHIVVGELAPKSMAIRRPETVSIWTAIPLYVFYWMMFPLIWLLNASANHILKLAGLDAVHEHEQNYSAEELKIILRTSRAPGRFTHREWDMLAQVIEFSEMTVRDILRPANELAVLYADQPFADNMKKITAERFSRYPVLEKNSGNILGVLHVKDIIARDFGSNDDMTRLLRLAVLVKEQMPAIELLRSFRAGGATQLAIVPDVNGVLGFVTFDDLLSAFLGDIHDEFHGKSSGWKHMAGGELRGSASLPVYSLERALGKKIPEKTSGLVSGLIMEQLQRLPEQGELVQFEDFSIKVMSVRGPRILSVKVIPGPGAQDD